MSRPPRARWRGTMAQIHDLLRGKGDYLYRTEKGWRLVAASGDRPVEFVMLSPAEFDWSVPEDPEKIYVFDFMLRRADLTAMVGDRLSAFLLACQARRLEFAVARPIPPEILPRGLSLNTLCMPSGCADCLLLFHLDKVGNTVFCDSSRLGGFRFTRAGRKQVFAYLELQHGQEPIRLANGERSKLRLLGSFACTERYTEDRPVRRRFDFHAYWVSKVGWAESEILRRYLNSYGDHLADGPILDDGGGHGKDTFFLQENGFRSVLIDIDIDLLRIAERRRHERGMKFPIVHGDARQLPFADATFSGVYSGGVMHHAMGPDGVQQYMAEAARTLRPGGLFFGNVWAYWDGQETEGVVTIDSPDVFERMLSVVGLSLIEPLETRHTAFEAHKHMWCFICKKGDP